MNILLIDKRVSRYEDIVAAIDPTLAVAVVFDYFEDTFDAVKARIGALGLTNTSTGISVGLLQHNYRAPMFTMLASADVAPVAQVAAQDPELERWTQFRDFIRWCNTEYNTAHFDMMACALYSDPEWKYVIDTLTAQTGVTVRASTDDTGAASLGGDWFLESHTGINLKTVYFTELIEEYRGILYIKNLKPSNIREYSTKGFATGSVQAWGDATYTTPGNVSSGVVAVYSNPNAFAALKTDGSVVAWGYSEYGGTTPGNVSSGVVAVYSNSYAFAALKTDGSVVAWGNLSYGGTNPGITSGVVSMYSNQYAFAALKSNGSVVAWGWDWAGGGVGGTPVTGVSSGVVAVYSTNTAFAALKTDGSIVAWGSSDNGGTTPGNVSSGVVSIYSTVSAFAALKTDGSVVAWGNATYGGVAPSTVTAANSGVVSIYSTSFAFAALKSDGSIVAWGGSSVGGTTPGNVSSGVVTVYSNPRAFAALKTDGSVVAWGDATYGGTTPGNVSSGVVSIYFNGAAFAALKTDGSVVAWGSSGYGGLNPGITSGVVSIYSTGYAFAALKSDGSVVAWGDSGYGGTNPGITSGGVAVYSNILAFAALKTTATTFDLSFSYYSNMDRYDILRKKENRRRVNLTTLNNNVFTLSAARDIQSFNPTMPTDKVLRIIVPTYVSSPHSITSTATIPSGAGSVIIACDEGEPVTISGTTYVNHGSYVYKRETNNTYTKLTTAQTISGASYMMYGGDGINSSGIALTEPIILIPVLSTFAVAASKTYGDASFNIATVPTSASNGAITYTSNATEVATIDASTGVITLVSAGTVTFTATQATTSEYSTATKTSNTLTVALGTTTLARTAMAATLSKTYGVDTSFNVVASSASSGAVTYTSSDSGVATVGSSTGLVTLVSAGSTTITAQQASSAQYSAPTSITSALTVALGTTTLALVGVASTVSKYSSDAPFTVTASSASSGAVTYTSSNTAVATVGLNTGLVTIIAAGSVTITAAQAATAFYSAPTSVTCVVTVGAVESLAGTTVTTSLADRNFTGASFANTVLTNVSLAGATLTNVNFSGATITGANFSNANIVGATNLPAFSTTQKLQLLRNAYNAAISAVQIATPLSGAEINAAITTPIPDIAGATFVVKAPAYDASGVKVITVTTTDISNNASLYIPMNSGETVKVNGVTYTFDGTNILNSSSTAVTFITVLDKPFRLYAGSIIGLNVVDKLNNVKIAGYGLYDILTDIFTPKNY